MKGLQDLKAHDSNLPEQESVTITAADIQQQVKNRKSWTTLGLDMTHTYWLKKLTVVHEHLAVQMNQLLAAGSCLDWIIQGRTMLLMKDPHKGTASSNYQPIICLHNMESPIRHYSHQIAGLYGPVYDHSSEGHWEQHQRLKTPVA